MNKSLVLSDFETLCDDPLAEGALIAGFQASTCASPVAAKRVAEALLVLAPTIVVRSEKQRVEI